MHLGPSFLSFPKTFGTGSLLAALCIPCACTGDDAGDAANTGQRRRSASPGEEPSSGGTGSAGAATDAGASTGGRDGAAGENSALSPRHVIIVIGDGMQLAHEVAESRYLFGADHALSFHQFPYSAFVTTWDIDGYDARANLAGLPPYSAEKFEPSVGYDPKQGGEAPYPLLPDTPERKQYFLGGPYPDSASTGSAMSTGQKTDYNNVAWQSGDPENGALESAPTTLRRLYGMSAGLVTTGPISHATPASWFSHNKARFDYFNIGHEILTRSRPEVIIGGGVGPEMGNYVNPADLDDAVDSGDWLLVRREAGVDGASSLLLAADAAVAQRRGLIGVFGGPDGNFESPVPNNQPGNPLVARGSIENPRLAEAAVSALKVLSQNPRGFFLLVEQADIDWANHNNDFSRMIGCVWDLHEAVKAIVKFVDLPNDSIDWTNTTVLVTADHANSYMRFVQTLGKGQLPAQSGGSYPNGEITYGSGSHTGEMVTLRAMGFAAPRVADYTTVYPGLPIIDNTSIYSLTLDAAKR